jgi:hypothetical protein
MDGNGDLRREASMTRRHMLQLIAGASARRRSSSEAATRRRTLQLIGGATGAPSTGFGFAHADESQNRSAGGRRRSGPFCASARVAD